MNAIKNKLQGLREIFYFDNWFQLLLSNTIFSRQPLQVYRKGKINVVSDKSKGDVMGMRNVITAPMYRVFLKEMQLPEKISLLDVGANVGGFAIMMKLNGHDPVKYVGVEMHPQNFSRLSMNILNNFTGQPQLLNQAVYNENGSINVSFTGGGTSESVAEIKNGGETVLPTITLDTLITQYFPEETIDLCKIDIEGSEYDIFFGHAFSQIKKARFILIEIHPNKIYKEEELVQVICNQDFRLVKQFEDVYLFKNELL